MEEIGLFLSIIGMFLTGSSTGLNLVAGNWLIACVSVGAWAFCVFAFIHFLEKIKSNNKIR